MKKISVLILALFTFCLVSCGDDGPGGSCANASFAAEFENQINDISDAITAFIADPSSSNCDALKSAYNSYFDALEDWEDCAKETNVLVEWQQSLDEARDSIDGLVC